jgi:hypothetical protein
MYTVEQRRKSMWMTTSEMGFLVTQEKGEVQLCRDIVEDRPVVHFLVSVMTDYIEVQDKRIGGERSHMILPDLEVMDRELDGTKTDDRQETIVVVNTV